MKHKKIFKKLLLVTIVIIASLILPVFSSRVQAMTIVIDPGHGGEDPGTQHDGIDECNMTMSISNYLKEYLSEYNDVNVLLTHGSGTTMSLNDRADFARRNNADLLISVHINSNILPFINGAEAYVTYRTDLPKYNEQMTALANVILNNISKLRN